MSSPVFRDDWLIEIIRDEIHRTLGGGARKPPPAPFVLGTVDPAYTPGSGRPKVVIDGDTSQTPAGPYPYLASYTPSANDRVLMARVGVSGKFVVIGKVV